MIRLLIILLLVIPQLDALRQINRQAVIARYSPTRNASSATTPLQVGNGNFAFGADITGLQTFLPWAIMSSWAWMNDTLPPNKTLTDVTEYHGTSWFSHDHLVQYNFGGESTIQTWLISNPNRVNLARIGLVFWDADGGLVEVTEKDLMHTTQSLDLFTGLLESRMEWDGEEIVVSTSSSQGEGDDTVAINIRSPLLSQRRLGVFVDFPWNSGAKKFNAPFVGVWNNTAAHSTVLTTGDGHARIVHQLLASQFTTTVSGDPFDITRDSPSAHRYTLQSTSDTDAFAVCVGFAPAAHHRGVYELTVMVINESKRAWRDYWLMSGFVDVVSHSTDPRANELQRRIVLSRYLMRVNEAGDAPPQEVRSVISFARPFQLTFSVQSGLVNTGWVSRFASTQNRLLTFKITVWKIPHVSVVRYLTSGYQY